MNKRELRKSMGLCTNCALKNDRTNKCLCSKCALKFRKYNDKYYYDNGGKKKKFLAYKEKYNYSVSIGVCTVCNIEINNSKRMCDSCLENYNKKSNKYYNSNKDLIVQRRKENRPKIREYENLKRKNDIQYRISKNLRCNIWHHMKNKFKSQSAIKSLGCTVNQLKNHLESQFKDGMTWDNYGSHWHIDHIYPLSKLDLTNEEDFNKGCHYTNLQPLWAEENLSKGNKL